MAVEEVSRDLLMEKAFDVAVYFVDYRQYGSEEKAWKALRRRCKGFSAAEYATALQQGVDLLRVAIEVVDREQDRFREAQNAEREGGIRAVMESLAGEARERCPGFPDPIYRNALGWVWHWYHER